MGHGHGTANDNRLSHDEMAGNRETNGEKKRREKIFTLSKASNSKIYGSAI